MPRVVPDTVQSAVPMDRGRDRSLGGAAPRSTAVSLSGRGDGGTMVAAAGAKARVLHVVSAARTAAAASAVLRDTFNAAVRSVAGSSQVAARRAAAQLRSALLRRAPALRRVGGA